MTVQPPQDPVSADTIASLSFDFLKQLTALSLAGAGGAAALLETVFTDSHLRPLVLSAVAILFLAAIFSLQAQQILVERMRAASSSYADSGFDKFKLPRTPKTERLMTMLAFGLFGGGVGILVFALAY